MLIVYMLTGISAVSAVAASGQPGSAVFERKDSQCAAYYDPNLPPAKDTEPFRGEGMFTPIAQGPRPNNAIRDFPPSVDKAAIAKGYRVTAKGELEVAPSGEVIRVRVTSSDDGRFAAFAAGEAAFWRYKPVATSKLCRKITVSFEWREGK